MVYVEEGDKWGDKVKVGGGGGGQASSNDFGKHIKPTRTRKPAIQKRAILIPKKEKHWTV